jgi:hypothetical protein
LDAAEEPLVALGASSDERREGLGDRGLPEAGKILDEDVAAREQPREEEGEESSFPRMTSRIPSRMRLPVSFAAATSASVAKPICVSISEV